MEEASDIYTQKIERLVKLLMQDVNTLSGGQYLREVHRVWSSMKAIIRAFESPCAMINDYLKTFGNNALADDHPLRDRSSVVAEGIRIIRKELIQSNKDKIGQLLLAEIMKLRKQKDDEVQQARDDMLEDLFQSFIVCD